MTMTTKAIEAISGLLGRTPLGREVLAAAVVEEERLAERPSHGGAALNAGVLEQRH